jgi:NAD(P)-dependent dehydrogenase (short-subunit alcohol dehydrogenase family)
MKRLEDKVALIIGAGTGLARSFALAFAREGADVCVAGRTLAKVEETAREIEKTGRRSLAIEADITKISDIEKMVNDCVRYFGRIDILVNSAGITLRPAVMEVKEEDWDAIMNVQLKGVFFTIQKCLPVMLKQGKGKIINLASALGVKGKAGDSVYCAAKAGIINLTRALAIELGSKGICVNALAPGFTVSSKTEHVTSNPELVKEILDDIPLGRLGKAEEITGAAIYLASDESDFTTGTTIFVDGGETIK